jgi:hypothetical protein
VRTPGSCAAAVAESTRTALEIAVSNSNIIELPVAANTAESIE